VPLGFFVWGVLIDGVEINVFTFANIGFDFSNQDQSVSIALL
jgi:hypothetical protein